MKRLASAIKIFVVTVAMAGIPRISSAQYTSSNRDVLEPNTGIWPRAGVSLGGTTFVNLGLQGVGRIPSSATDPSTGESLGSISDMQVTEWASSGNGEFSGVFSFLPDRGFNSGSTFSNYAARINQFSFTFKPYTSSAATTQQNQINFTGNLGSTRFTYDHDGDPATAQIPTTGLLATASASLFGLTAPASGTPTTIDSVTVNNRLTLDSEGLAFDPRAVRSGSGWIGDEYGAYVYHFDADKQIDSALALPAALVPHAPAGTIDFAQDPPANGRRVNQGMEGIAVNQEGTRLFALLQSAAIQDSGGGNQGRSNTRLLVYDISTSDSPSQPVAQYVIQLPRIDDTGSTTNGGTVNRTGAQSSIVALNDHQLLLLSRDGNSRGATGLPVFKSVLLADLANATNINGSFDGEGAAVAPGGQLQAAVTPIAWTEALNLLGKLDLSIAELEKFGLNLSSAPGDLNTLSEKWEAMSLVSVGDPATPNDYFLFIGNDNDFMTASGKLLDADGTLQNYNAGLENDTLVLAYRVQIVPEPSTMAFLALAGFGLAIVVLRHQQFHRS